MLYHDAFYRFVHLEDVAQTQATLFALCERLGFKGSILLAQEGINGMLCGELANLDAFWQELYQDSRFAGMIYKRTTSSKQPFRRLKVRIKPEIVPLGIDGVDASAKTGVQVAPQDWRTLIQEPDVILIDNRNDFEYQLGTFEGAVNPKVDKFRDFVPYVEAHRQEWQGKRIAMFCTGGIRCEKASSWMLDEGFEVYQLEGGILNYFAQMPDPEQDYHGECFVFDDRAVLTPQLEELSLTGVAVAQS